MWDYKPTKLSGLTQFSLLNLVLTTTIVALGVGLYSSGRRNARLDARNQALAVENKKHREMLGIFDIEDPTQIHAIRVPTEGDEPRRFRIYLPEGRTYAVNYQANRIPESGLGEYPNPQVLQPGEYLIGIKITRSNDPTTGKPSPSVHVDFQVDATHPDNNNGVSAGIGISEMWNDWIVNNETGQMAYSWNEIGRELELHDLDQPLIVYRARPHTVKVLSRDNDGKPTSYTTSDIDGPTDGFMVWIESKPLETTE